MLFSLGLLIAAALIGLNALYSHTAFADDPTPTPTEEPGDPPAQVAAIFVVPTEPEPYTGPVFAAEEMRLYNARSQEEQGHEEAAGRSTSRGDSSQPEIFYSATPYHGKYVFGWQFGGYVGIDDYRVYRRLVSEAGPDLEWQTVLPATDNVILVDTDGAVGFTYQYYVEALDNSGAVLAKIPTHTGTMRPQKRLRAVGSDTKVRLDWHFHSPTLGVSGYRVYRENVSDGIDDNWTILVESTIETSYIDLDVVANTTYRYQVYYLVSGEVPSPAIVSNPDYARAITRSLSAPQSLTARDPYDRHPIKLSWSPPSVNPQDVALYEVSRRVAPSEDGDVAGAYKIVGTTMGTTMDDWLADTGVKYQYVVKAVDAFGNRTGGSNTAEKHLGVPTRGSWGKPWVTGAKYYRDLDAVLVYWTANDSEDLAGFKIERRVYGGTTPITFENLWTGPVHHQSTPAGHTYEFDNRPSVGPDRRYFIDTSAPPSYLVFYRVFAVRDDGSETASFRSDHDSPDMPYGIVRARATIEGTNVKHIISWTDAGCDDGYNIYKRVLRYSYTGANLDARWSPLVADDEDPWVNTFSGSTSAGTLSKDDVLQVRVRCGGSDDDSGRLVGEDTASIR